MLTKLTLTVEQDVVELAKKYAGKNGRSLSDLVENYLKVLVHKHPARRNYSPIVSELLGSVKLPPDFDYKTELTDALTKKYGK